APLAHGAATKLTVRSSGAAMLRPDDADAERYGRWGQNRPEDAYYPRPTVSWYPAHGYLQRSTFDVLFLHRKDHLAISTGVSSEEQGEAAKGERATRWKMDKPVAFTTFVVGDFGRYSRPADAKTPPVNYYYMAGRFLVKESENEMLTELSNAVRFYSELFGPYPFEQASAVLHPRQFGQGVPSLLLLTPTLRHTSKRGLSFMAHEMAHQWWGHVVSWKTYRDQWLSEGFAEYSAALYVRARMDRDAEAELIREKRRALITPPMTETGILTGKVAELGPLILGLRAAPPRTLNAYYALTYFKGALVLRMLHFLFTNPGTGDDSAFYAMMKDFTSRYAGRAATTEDFFAVASEHFRRAPLGIKYHMQNLDWFYNQWVLQAVLPSYRLEYSIQPQPNGVLLNGVLKQIGAPDDWFMPLPLVIRLNKTQEVRGSVQVKGAQSTFSIPLPSAPLSVTLDPDLYVLSEKTETSR
ncbi:MAG: M1 family aminopeptidase, partial [Bryobacteraceae bacterium]